MCAKVIQPIVYCVFYIEVWRPLNVVSKTIRISSLNGQQETGISRENSRGRKGCIYQSSNWFNFGKSLLLSRRWRVRVPLDFCRLVLFFQATEEDIFANDFLPYFMKATVNEGTLGETSLS